MPGQCGPESNDNEGCAPYSPKPKHYLDLTIGLFSVIARTLVVGGYPSAEKQSVYSTAPADWAIEERIFLRCLYLCKSRHINCAKL